ncbi:MAG: hypothetical protein JY451_10455 [Erythrobacter sp.]|nr:MAG: hypothetical protein JY451_10455 [Erythrobacter sp.]
MASSAASESKSFASLGPMLLARKGTAKPAMRVQLEQSDRVATLGDDFDMLASSQDALGWNDMGDHDSDDHVVALPVANKRQQLAQKAQTVAGDTRRAAFTLRLDAERHLKLRLASTLQDRSAQKLVTEALDSFLSAIPELDAIAARVRRTTKNS